MNIERGLLRMLLWPVHRALIRASGGRLGTTPASARRVGTLILTTTGRRSGRERTTPVYFVPNGENWVVVASNAGDDRDPDWYLNLKANPNGSVQTPKGRFLVRARDTKGAERDELWQRLTAVNPGFRRYEQRTDRPIPVVVLERR